jgi:3-oxoacyl-[acyl-carrier-protein] synthase-3
MSIFSIPDIVIRGISATVPAESEDNETLDLIPVKERKAFIEQTGIRYRHIAPPGLTASDLCTRAAESLIKELDWSPDDVDILIFITQTPDYIIPNTASVIHHRLGLSKNCLAFDINLGCSGYIYGLSVIGSLLQNIKGGKGLLLVGDCSTALISKTDKSTWPLFSDAGSATALEQSEGNTWHFNLQSDGSGYQDIMITSGGQRSPFSAASLISHDYGSGISRNDLQMKLDGINIFNFALREVTPNIQSLLDAIHIPQSSIDYFILHQGNKLMLECIRKKMNEEQSKFPYSLYRFGNTSSASIPVTIVTELQTKLTEQSSKLLLSGFGVGLSWGSVYLSLDKAKIFPLIEV